MKSFAVAFAAAGFMLAAGSATPMPANAQVIAGWNTAGQWDRGGDYRCDAYWDANRTDCDAAWRTPRGGARYDYRGRGHGYGDRYGYGYDHSSYGYGHGRHDRWRGHGRQYGHGYGWQAPATAYPAAYGRPDLVYGGSDHGYGYGARDPRRVDWCRRNYRSYDPYSGYYRAYSGRLVWCG
ncbi:BA14K family protein [Brevundimonas fluminis]|jgi:hypothetical protein|uniref:BA14K family protein n=1 Tax=Brevundimonas fluminis TaxID=2487274 RepID=UPI000F657C52|nr:BA14K family protein [Brevundimonas fluminis]